MYPKFHLSPQFRNHYAIKLLNPTSVTENANLDHYIGLCEVAIPLQVGEELKGSCSKSYCRGKKQWRSIKKE